ncbi:hypothetical protein HLB44_25640 [Aquincola sp. S2]|uniref:DUF995 domain-containing protein n=1 Tax=Pseudaquabacterium terrae TaxID=2732868 RepID=A0ABX2EP97_9BURK|nr:hypothetical protein [Aquabacterium terrae]NRF70393.1 hypothetical protein [Aquabacterium terrae]
MRTSRLVVAALIAILLGVGQFTPALSNAWRLLTSRGFVLPAESSIWRFRVTQMNEGSGGWWLYGEDDRYYYRFIGRDEAPYEKITRREALRCQGFDARRYESWCRK